MQQIFASAKAKFISKLTIKVTENLAMMSKSQNSIIKRKANSNNKYLNYGKLGTRDETTHYLIIALKKASQKNHLVLSSGS